MSLLASVVGAASNSLADPTTVVAPVAAKSYTLKNYLVANWFNFASATSSVFVLSFSVWSLSRSSSDKKVAGQRADISSHYAQFTDFNRLRLEFPEQSHLMEGT
jgi:hypothetical protein